MVTDGYPKFDQQDMTWFMAEARRIAHQHPEDVRNVGRRKAGLDLELLIDVAPRSRALFTMRVCLELAAKVAQRTRVAKPVVYVAGQPHARAAEVLGYADGQG